MKGILGKSVTGKWFPAEGEKFPIVGLNMIRETSSGRIRRKDTVANDFCIKAVRVKVKKYGIFQDITATVNGINFRVDANTGKINGQIPIRDSDIECLIAFTGSVDFESGIVYLSANSSDPDIAEPIAVQFGGHLWIRNPS